MGTEFLRIGVFGRVFHHGKIRGLSRHTLNLLLAIHRVAPEVEIYIYSDIPIIEKFKELLNFATFRDHKVRPHMYWEQVILPLQLRRDKIQVFHSPVNIGVPYACKALGVQTVLTLHDIFGQRSQIMAKKGLRFGAWWSFLNFQLSWQSSRISSKIITVSEYSKSQIVALYPALVSRITVIPNGVDPVFTPGTPDPSVAQSLKLPQRYVIYVGGFEERKNVVCLIRAFAILEKKYSDLGLLLIGSQEQMAPEIKEISGKLRGVCWAGYRSDEEVVRFYQNALCGVVPSKDEGFGFSIIEGLACETPMLAARSSSLPEVGGSSVAYFDPDAPEELATLISRMIEYPEWRSQMIKNSISHIKQFSWDEIARKTLAVYSL